MNYFNYCQAKRLDALPQLRHIVSYLLLVMHYDWRFIMEVHAFDTNDVEYKLYDIQSAFEALSFAVNGLKNYEQISDEELSGFEYIIRDAKVMADDLINGLKPVWFQDSGKIVLLFGEEE